METSNIEHRTSNAEGIGSVDLRSTAENWASRQHRPTVPFKDGVWVINADVFAGLKQVPDKSVQCVVTSPPYWGLRSYLPKEHPLKGFEIGQEKVPDCQNRTKNEERRWKMALCGECYVCTMVRLFREIWRVLRDDGTVWLNLGDTYANGGNGGGGSFAQNGNKAADTADKNVAARVGSFRCPKGFKPKDLIGIPWRVALALQADGWYLRSDIVWAKPNCMPESVTDRPTRSHEYLFLLTKSPRYFYDAEAIKEAVSENTHARVSQDLAKQVGSYRTNGGNKTNGPMKAVIAGSTRKIAEEGQGKRNASYEQAMCLPVASRNKRSVWWVSPGQYSEAHFATFPPELIKPCILAGTSAGGACAQCGAPFIREIEVGNANLEHQKACGGDANGEYNGHSTKNHAAHGVQDASAVKARILEGLRARKTVGWEPTCKCNEEGRKDGINQGSTESRPTTGPCIVLDPFGGSGTTAAVAIELGQQAILTELNPEYVKLIEQRLAAVTPGLRL